MARAKTKKAPRPSDSVETLDGMDPEERAALEASLRRAEREYKAGLGRPAEEIFARLGALRRRK